MRICLTLLILWCSGICWAAPNLGEFRDIAGVRVYRDHQRTDLGSQATGDRNAFWVRGVLSLNITREWQAKVTAQIRDALTESEGKRPKLRSMPVAEARIRLLFGDLDLSWQQGSRWSGGQVMLPLTPEPAELLWQAAERGQTPLSLTVEEQLAGLRRQGGDWQEEQVSATGTLPVTLDMKTHPDQFRRTSLGGRMVRGYTGIDVFCFDFLENLEPLLYAKTVEVAIPTEGRDLIKELVFRDDGIYRGHIDFELSREIDRPYRFRITRILKNGSRESGSWQEKTGDSLLDVTRYLDDSQETVESKN
jgi:hypothetical protein